LAPEPVWEMQREKNLLLRQGIKPRFLGRPAVTYWTLLKFKYLRKIRYKDQRLSMKLMEYKEKMNAISIQITVILTADHSGRAV
jgi:hypothetical protein